MIPMGWPGCFRLPLAIELGKKYSIVTSGIKQGRINELEAGNNFPKVDLAELPAVRRLSFIAVVE